MSGSEGFLILFNWRDDNNWTWWNIGGWGDTLSAVEQMVAGSKSTLSSQVSSTIQTGQWYDVRIVLTGARMQCYLDNALIHDVTYPNASLLGSASYVTGSGQVILKAVNVTGNPITTTLNLNGLASVDSQASLVQIASTNSAIENSLAAPTNIVPVTSTITNVGTTFTLTLPANSLSVLRLGPQPPAFAPTGLQAVPGNGQVALSWNVAAEATSYNLKRATASGGPYTVIATQAGTSFTDFNVANESTYFYVVSAANVAGEGADSSPVSAVPRTLPTAGLWAFWRFDETTGTSAFDSSLNGRAALLTGGASWAAGKINNAASLNGSTGYVSCPNNLLNGVTNFTIAAWVNPATDSTWARVFDFGSNTTTNMFLTPRNGVTGGIRFAITTGSFGSEQQLTGSSALPAATWSHVAVTLSNTTGILYVNGVGVATNTSMTLTPSSLGNTTQNWLGRSHYNDPYFYGRIDDFRIYDRPLSATEVQSLTNLPGLTAFQLWQYQYFGSTNCSTCAGNSDYDGDGMSNFDEFLAGTSPTNSASAFQILSIVPVSNDIVITWQSVAGKTNAVEANSADISGPMFITGSQTNYTDPSALTNTPSRLYRIRLVP
jgi:hypothetical protein